MSLLDSANRQLSKGMLGTSVARCPQTPKTFRQLVPCLQHTSYRLHLLCQLSLLALLKRVDPSSPPSGMHIEVKAFF
jgi:hypothetical protein